MGEPRGERPRSRHVFVNCSFDAAYEPLFVTLLAALTALGRVPRSVLEVAARRDRLTRLLTVIDGCALSVHDLSRVERHRIHEHTVPRFNMPFELGLTLGASRLRDHDFILLEAKRGSIEASLSDLKGYDGVADHGGAREGMLRAISRTVEVSDRAMGIAGMRRCADRLRHAAKRLKEHHGRRDVFTRDLFEQLCTLGASYAAQEAKDSVSSRP